MTTSDIPRLLYWDSCVFIDYIEKNPEKIAVLDLVWDEIDSRPGSKIYTSELTTVEVAHVAGEKNRRKLDPTALEQLDDLWYNNPLVEIIEVHRKITTLARDLVRQGSVNDWRLKGADAVHLATAQFLKQARSLQECHTYETRLRKYGDLIGMTVCDPYAQRPRLFPGT
jgi:predicted nucleic acid-binding protein